MNELGDLYQEVILDNYKHPKNYGALEDATHKAFGDNPLCGDKLALHVRVKSGAVDDLRFTIAGVGQELASISFERSNEAGQYFAKMQMRSGCILVATGRANKVDQIEAGYAFISPRSGKVFRSGEECRGR